MLSLDNKTVLVTGSAQGIGYTMARAFAARGARLILSDLNPQSLAEAVKKLESEGHTVQGVVMDVTNQDQIDKARKEVNDGLGPVDVLVNNAGVVFGGTFLETELEQHELTYNVNTMGVVNVTHKFLPDMINRPDAHLVNIASASGMIGLPYGATYASSKWSVIGFSESIRLELRQLGHTHVNVTTVNPGYVDTGMFNGIREPWGLPLLDPEDLADKVVAAVEANETWLSEPAFVKWVPLLKGIFPQRIQDWFMWQIGVSSSMKKWHGHGKQSTPKKKSA